jgi:hypothetical protein
MQAGVPRHELTAVGTKPSEDQVEMPQENDATHVTPAAGVIEVRCTNLRNLFNSIDPSPFHERDLDPRAEEFIVRWARDLPRDAPLALLVHVDAGVAVDNEVQGLQRAVQEFFNDRAQTSRQSLRHLFRVGRIALAIGLACLAFSIGVGDLVSKLATDSRLGELARESLLIGGWVAMWRPMDVFLYDWWPIRAEMRLYTRLGSMPVRIVASGR